MYSKTEDFFEEEKEILRNKNQKRANLQIKDTLINEKTSYQDIKKESKALA